MHQQALSCAVGAVTHGMDQIDYDARHRRRVVELVDSHPAYLRGLHGEPLARQNSTGIGQIDHKAGRALQAFNRGLQRLAGVSDNLLRRPFRVGYDFHRAQNRSPHNNGTRNRGGGRTVLGFIRWRLR